MTQFDSFSIAAAIVALVLAGSFVAANLVQRGLRVFRWWAVAFLLLAIWLATSTLRPDMAPVWVRWLSWSCLLGATSVLIFGLHRDGGGGRWPAPAALVCGALLIAIASALSLAGAPLHFWMLLGPLPTIILLSWSSIPALQRGGWLPAAMFHLGTAALVIRSLFHPAGAARLFAPPPPPPALRGALSPAGGPAESIGLAGMPGPPGPGLSPALLPPAEHALVGTLVTIAALVILAGALVLRELLGELDRMRRRSSTDAMTGLLNRAAFEEAARALLGQAPLQPLSVVMLDIDHFKRINDTAGHAAGDRVIARLGQILGEVDLVRTVAGRIGGEEFAVLLPGCTVDTARLFAETIRTSFAASDFAIAVDWPITVSAGIALYRAGESLDDLTARADKALYAAKANGRDQVAVAPDGPHRAGSMVAA